MTNRSCKHENADHLTPGEWFTMRSEHGDQPMHVVDFEQFRCLDCGAWLSLGPSNDSPPEVQIEIRAAELAADAVRGVGVGGHKPEHCTGDHCWHFYEEWEDDAGPCCYCGHPGPILPGVDNECHVGHLAARIGGHP